MVLQYFLSDFKSYSMFKYFFELVGKSLKYFQVLDWGSGFKIAKVFLGGE